MDEIKFHEMMNSEVAISMRYRHVRLVVDEICFPYISETIGLFDIFSLPTVKTIYGVFPIEGYLSFQ